MTPHQVTIATGFPDWRNHARDALASGYLPEEILFVDAGDERPRLPGLDIEADPTGPHLATPHAPRDFLREAETAAAHRDPDRWNLLYRLLHRLQTQRQLLKVEVDDDVAHLHRLTQQVSRDIHKMHAFVRFRRVEEPSPAGAPREHFIAYYKPEHRILRLAAPFFTERFAIMRWTILTPDETASWNPDTKQLHFGPGVPRDHAPADSDADLEDLWRGYYGAIFNPARVNPAVMRREMPIRYWEHLPELTLLPTLLQRAEDRVAIMVAKQSKLSAAPFVPAKHSLPILRAAMPKCEGCDLYKHAIQVVPGAGAAHARLMLVGEQPGDQEDQQGEPFVGPAGGVLRRALAELNIEPKTIFLTNAVKHFKFVERGKLRLHQSPRMSEVSACRPWLEAEIDAVKPKVVLAMGATAAKSLFGSTFHLMEQHGQLIASKYAQQAMATVHPSAILRAPDEEARHQLYALMKTDLERAHTASLAAK